MPHFIPENAYSALITDLSAAFTSAANSTDHTLSDLLAVALAKADLLPERCRADFAADSAVAPG